MQLSGPIGANTCEIFARHRWVFRFRTKNVLTLILEACAPKID